ncbi:hypothetical protein Tco_1496781 [Tanacetum coccineum]
MDNIRPRGSYSPIKRSYYTKPAFRPKDLKQDVKTFGVQNMTTAGIRAVVNTDKGKIDTDLKKSRWVWRPKGNYLDHVSKDNGSFMLKKVECVDPKWISKSVMAWGRKPAKSEPIVHKDPAFDDLDDDAMDYIETEDDQDKGRTSSVVLEDKESIDKEVSTEAPVSTVKPNEGTDKRNEGTDKQDGGTDSTKVSTDRQGEGTADQNEGKSATQTAPTTTSTPTPTIFGDDETIT